MALSQNTNSIVSSYMISRELIDLSCFLLKPLKKLYYYFFYFFLGGGPCYLLLFSRKKYSQLKLINGKRTAPYLIEVTE